MNILAINRRKNFSPNHIGNDAAIMRLVCDELTSFGAAVRLCDEESFMQIGISDTDGIISMGRSRPLLLRLQQLEDGGMPIFNSSYSIRNCFRKNMTEQLLANGISYPASVVQQTHQPLSTDALSLAEDGLWIKRGDFHAIHKEDVTFAATIAQAQNIIEEYALRNIKEAVISRHLRGDLVKFYAVRGTSFFYSFYPYEVKHHKYEEYEQINGHTNHYTYDAKQLHQLAERSAEVLGVEIYGGDAIIQKDGSIHIIDLNDWPSFAPCREEAAKVIAHFLFKKLSTQNETKKSATISGKS